MCNSEFIGTFALDLEGDTCNSSQAGAAAGHNLRTIKRVKITLHDSIPEARRPEIEALVRKHAGDCTIAWASSRFPRLVILVEPHSDSEPDTEAGSFFESPRTDELSPSAFGDVLETRIKAYLVDVLPN